MAITQQPAAIDPTTSETLKTVESFNDAFNRHDVDAIMDLMTVDCIFESTSPAPDGGKFSGHDSIRPCWIDLFASSRASRFDAEEIIAFGDRCIVRWVYRWTDHDGIDGHVRGVDVMRIRDGKLSEKLSYVKG